MTCARGFSARALAPMCLGIAWMLLGSSLAPQRAEAQQVGQTPQGRDCQTVRTCNFTRTGAVRGCLSSYSCRACRMVATKCTLPNTGACRELRCDWGA